MDRLELVDRALATTGEIVAAVRPEQLDGPTPCGDWTLRELLAHMVVSNDGFAAAASGAPVGGDVWDSLAIVDDVYTAYMVSAAAVSAAFASPADPDKIEIFGYGTLPLSTALGMHIVDFVVHGWDVARSIDWTGGFDTELVEAAYRIMLRFPTGRPNKAFGVMVAVPDDASVVDRLMGYVGRDPGWRPPTAG